MLVMFENRKKLMEYIVELMETKNLTMIEASVHVSETYDIDIKQIADAIKRQPTMKAIIEAEALAIGGIKNDDELA